jgi:hypothetical protein
VQSLCMTSELNKPAKNTTDADAHMRTQSRAGITYQSSLHTRRPRLLYTLSNSASLIRRHSYACKPTGKLQGQQRLTRKTVTRQSNSTFKSFCYYRIISPPPFASLATILFSSSQLSFHKAACLGSILSKSTTTCSKVAATRNKGRFAVCRRKICLSSHIYTPRSPIIGQCP